MKNLLKYIRRANGSLAEGLLTDMRSHHYVLCGATIPNWVIKAGFLGVKKYYYQLVAAGSVKLPEGLEVLRMPCPYEVRVRTAAQLLRLQHDFFGRTIVFGTPKQVAALEKELLAAVPAALSVRTLTEAKDEVERLSAVEDFNSKTADTLLCTDIAARGLDMVEAQTVLMLSLPSHVLAAETFVHRAGRTARVFHTGRCLVLHDATEREVLDGIARTTHATFKLFVPAGAAAEAGGAKKGKAEPSATVRLQLTVRNPFQFTKPNVKVPSAVEVLEKQLANSPLRASLTLEASESPEVVRFSVPASVAHEVKAKLWKYKLEELH
ncbi:RNA helicase [Strigomonas culicis]|uniref:RNA helicase n=1 Tax=Strigomonas culicis TaxID=28005 RepID=S9U1X5_9TRYP|nr:RNA helicase [Strigomonas culicis]|eukprot:EPY24762.1 RNA helicase [Strigomonas culicis]